MFKITSKLLNFLNRSQKIKMSYLIILSAIVAVLELINIKIFSASISTLLNETDNKSADKNFLPTLFNDIDPLVLMACSMVILVTAKFMYTNLINYSSVSVGRSIQKQLLSTITNLEHSEFTKRQIGQHSATLLHKINMIISGIYLPVIRLAANACALILILIALLSDDSQLFFIFILLLSFVILISYSTSTSARSISQTINESTDRVSTELLLILRNRRDLIINQLITKLTKDYLAEDLYIRLAHFKIQLLQITPRFAIELGIGAFLLILAIIKPVGLAGLSISSLLLAILILMRLIPPAMELQSSIVSIYSHSQVLDDVIIYKSQNAWNIPHQKKQDEEFEVNIVEGDCNSIEFLEIRSCNNGQITHRPITTKITRGVTQIDGPNGSGKSSLIDIIIGARAQSSSVRGKINIKFKNERADDIFALCSQEPTVIPGLLQDNISKTADMELATKLAAYFELPPVISQSLSGGEKQKLAIIRALSADKPVVILDEPSSALDSKSVLKLKQLLQNPVNPKSIYILVTHDVRLQKIADHKLQLSSASSN